MSSPKIAQRAPIALTLDPGEYYWCRCGLSAGQPFCDGAHKGSEFTPMAFAVKEKTQVYLCQCKHTANPPYCDGTHSKLK